MLINVMINNTKIINNLIIKLVHVHLTPFQFQFEFIILFDILIIMLINVNCYYVYVMFMLWLTWLTFIWLNSKSLNFHVFKSHSITSFHLHFDHQLFVDWFLCNNYLWLIDQQSISNNDNWTLNLILTQGNHQKL